MLLLEGPGRRRVGGWGSGGVGVTGQGPGCACQHTPVRNSANAGLSTRLWLNTHKVGVRSAHERRQERKAVGGVTTRPHWTADGAAEGGRDACDPALRESWCVSQPHRHVRPPPSHAGGISSSRYTPRAIVADACCRTSASARLSSRGLMHTAHAHGPPARRAQIRSRLADRLRRS